MRKLAFGFLGIAIFTIAVGVMLLDSSIQKSTQVDPVVSEVTNVKSSATERYAARVDRVDVVFEQWEYTKYRLTTNGMVREGELNSERGYGDDVNATVYVLNWQKPEGEQMRYVRLTEDPTHLFILDGNREIIQGSALTLSQ